MKRTTFTYQVDQNRIGDILRRLDLAKIGKGREDQVPETHN